MGLSHSPRIVSDNLVLCLDAGNLKSYDPNAGVFGQKLFNVTGTSSWTVPDGVTEISAVVVGGGGGGAGAGGGSGGGTDDGGGGGAGGGLAYGTFTVTPGESLTIIVGAGGNGGTGGSSTPTNGSVGGLSRIQRGATNLLQGGGGNAGTYDMSAQNSGGTSTGTERDGGGSGGGGQASFSQSGGGGGGAAGYSGNGGAGGLGGSADPSGSDGSGGGGGGGGSGASSIPGGGGGGVGILGQGSNGSGGSATVSDAGGGSGGSDGSDGNNTTDNGGNGGLYGGGGGGGATNGTTDGDGGDGGQGAVRIIWGAGRSYPSTSTADMLASPDITNIGPKGARNISSLVGAAHTTDNGGAIVFDGTDDQINCGSSNNFAFGTGDFTIEFWCNPDTLTTEDINAILAISSTGSIQTSNWQFRYNSSKVRWVYSQTANITSSSTVSAGEWTHVVATRSGTALTLYINAVSEGTGTSSADLSQNGILRIGCSRNQGNFFNGKISNVKIYKGKGLTATEVLQNFNALRGRYGV